MIFSSVLILWTTSASVIFAGPQKNERPAGRQPVPAPIKKAWRLAVSKKTPPSVTLKAADAPLVEIAAELGKQLKVPVQLGPVMHKQRVTLDLSLSNLETALRFLAPQVYIDYEAGGDFSTPPKVLAIYLQGLNETPPVMSAYGQSQTAAILIEGDTEEGTEAFAKAQAAEENSLVISYSRNQLSVRAHQQPLSVVLYKIANEVGVPFDMRHETNELINVNFKQLPLDQAVRTLSPLARIYYRADLQTFEIQPLRLSLVQPAKTASST